ncbi:MAG: hypothetical protein ACP5U1_10565 [Desulfomonilaceae bacterium]
MLAAVKALPQEILKKIDYREWSLRTKEGLERYKQLKAKSLPALAINDRLVFECLIPPAEQIIAAINDVDQEM